jgi:hypothetical protein
MSTKTSNYRHRGYGTEDAVIEVFGSLPAPVDATGAPLPLLWDNWVENTSTVTPYAGQ